MIKKIAAAASAALILMGTTGCSMTKRDLEKKEVTENAPATITFLGDSIAAGYGLDGYTADSNYNCPDSYANTLAAKYKEELSKDNIDTKMYDLAVSGHTTDDLIGLLSTSKLDDALAESDVVVVSIGGNDLLGIVYEAIASIGAFDENGGMNFDDINIFAAVAALMQLDSDVEEALVKVEANMEIITKELTDKTEGDVYIQTLYNPLEAFTDIQMLTDFAVEKMGKFNDIVKSSAEKNGCGIIDIAAAFEGKNAELTRINSFDIHPNEKGHKLIADEIDKVLRNKTYTYTIEEYGDPYLTLSSIMLISGGVLAVVAMLIIIPKLFKKHEKK